VTGDAVRKAAKAIRDRFDHRLINACKGRHDASSAPI
jgi:hypothetical protein